MGIKEKMKDYAMNHYHSMPKSIQRKMIDEGKKQIDKDHPIASCFMSENKKEQLVEQYFTKREVETYQRKYGKKRPNWWDF